MAASTATDPPAWWRPGRARRERYWAGIDEAMSKVLQDLSEVQLEIIRLRWLDQAKRYDNIWRDQRLAHYWFRVPIIIGAATVPVLASLSVPRIATALVGLAVAILTGLDSLFQFGARWQLQRRAALAMNFEGWEFLELSGAYAKQTRAAAYPSFIGNVEALNERLSMAYLDVFRDDSRSLRTEVVDTGKS